MGNTCASAHIALTGATLTPAKIFKTAAVCTSLYDSDTFEVVLFNAGKQVDLVLTDPERSSGPLIEPFMKSTAS